MLFHAVALRMDYWGGKSGKCPATQVTCCWLWAERRKLPPFARGGGRGGGAVYLLRDQLGLLLLWGQFLMSQVGSREGGQLGPWGSNPVKGKTTEGAAPRLQKELTGRLAMAGGGRSMPVKGKTTEEAAAWAAKGVDGEASWGLMGLTPVKGEVTEGAATWVAEGADGEAGWALGMSTSMEGSKTGGAARPKECGCACCCMPLGSWVMEGCSRWTWMCAMHEQLC